MLRLVDVRRASPQEGANFWSRGGWSW